MPNNNVDNSDDDDLPRIIDNMTWKLDQPDLEELVTVMDEYLSPYFNHFAVNVVECPDLTLPPYFLTAPGLCGNAEVIELGDYDHLYNPARIKTLTRYLPQLLNRYTERTSLVIGGTMYRGRHSTVPNKEVVMNLTYSEKEIHKKESNYIFLNEEGQVVTECITDRSPFFCDVYGSLYVCRGKREKVLEVYAKGARIPHVQILNLMRHALYCRYFRARVGLSGLLFISEGEVEATIMPRTFSQTLLQDEKEIYEWNHKCNITAPVVVHNIMFNFREINFESDNGGLTVCTVNSCSSQILQDSNRQFVGSRFHRCTTPDKMECKGYFNVVSKLHRVQAEVIN